MNTKANAVPTVAAARFVPYGADCRQLVVAHMARTVVSADVVVHGLVVAATMYIAY